MPSIEEYVMVDSTRHWVRRYRRDNDGWFVADVDQIGGSIRIASIGYVLDVDAMYEMARVERDRALPGVSRSSRIAIAPQHVDDAGTLSERGDVELICLRVREFVVVRVRTERG